MQAVILAAGVGKRLGHLTKTSTKCMVELNGRKLIDYMFEALVEAGVGRAVMVVGHGADEVRRFLGSTFRGVAVTYVENPVYAKTNNIYSLYLAKNYMEEDDTLLLESDIIFDRSLLKEVRAHEAENLAVVAKFQSWMDGTVATMDAEDNITSFIPKKKLDWADLGKYYKTVNIYKLSRTFCRSHFLPFLGTYIEAKGVNEYYEEVLKILTFIDSGALKAFEMGDRLWYEIDDIQDMDIASLLFSGEEDRLALLKKRYGGYWRFPFLKDFCYLVNPYFPSRRMLLELGQNFPVLLMNYPSGQNVQNLLAAKMHNGNIDHFLVGNGASELIKALLRELEGKVGIRIPTFDEYTACVRKGELVEFKPARPDFAYTTDDIYEFAVANKLATYILINPDNPTGHFLPRADILGLLDRFREKGIRLILDESFADFVDGTANHSFLDNAILEKYPNLIVVKSISKSYGVPGARLGFMATSDAQAIALARKNLSIWNINSFGENFLQIIDKYKGKFQTACRRIEEERNRFAAELQKIPFLRPLPSKANYILCEVKAPWTSGKLAEALIRKRWIFIKDLAGKKGFEGGSWIRLTIRDKADDDALLEALKELS
jgi:histidinol-phosphate/aromatic aminotransferase/cobyric acid decarboxylase-like protein/choline kinase